MIRMQRNELWLIALVMFLGMNAHAQNTFPPDGNVGIGTTTPGQSSKSSTKRLLDKIRTAPL